MGRGMQGQSGIPGRSDVETWFVQRGVPQLVEGYASEQRIDARATPWLVLWLVAGTVLWWGVRPGAPAVSQVVGVAGTLLLMGVSVAALRRARGREAWWVDPRLETAEVFTLGLAVAVASGVVEMSLPVGVQDGGRALVGLGVIYATIGLGLVAIGRWAVRRLLQELSRIVGLLAGTLPVLLILVLFLLFAAELWEAADLLTVGEVLAVIALLTALAGVLVLSALRTELQAMAVLPHSDLAVLAAATPAGPLAVGTQGRARVRLRPLQRLNLSALVLVGQLIQSVFVAALVTVFLVVFGLLTLPAPLQQRWLGGPPDDLVQLGTVLGEPRVLTAELLSVSLLLGAVVGLYFTGLAVTDTAFRAAHFERLLHQVRVLVAAHALYLTAVVEREPPRPADADSS